MKRVKPNKKKSRQDLPRGGAFTIRSANAGLYNNPRYGDIESAMFDGDEHQSIYECKVNQTVIRDIITGKSSQKIKIGLFKIKYPQTKPLTDLQLEITPNKNKKHCPKIAASDIDIKNGVKQVKTITRSTMKLGIHI
eukprot:40847_1